MAIKQYRVVGAWEDYDGIERPDGFLVSLDERAAEYSRALGQLALVGAVPADPVPPLVLASDVVRVERGGQQRIATVEALRDAIHAEMVALIDAKAAPSDINSAILALKGDVSASGDTLAKLRALIAELSEALALTATPTDLAAAINLLKGEVDPGLDTLAKLAAAIVGRATVGDIVAAISTIGVSGPVASAIADAVLDRPTRPEVASTLASLAAAVLDGLSGKAGSGVNTDITRLSGTSSAPGVDVDSASTSLASTATVNIGAAPTKKIEITGNGTITAFDAVPHKERWLRFQGAATLTHNAITLVIPGATNLVTAPGDMCKLTSDASGRWRVRDYTPADGGGLSVPLPAARGGTGAASLLAAFTALAAALPTALPGSPGQLWNNGGTLAIS